MAEQTLNQLLVERASEEKLALVTVLIEKAKKGDKTALETLSRALSTHEAETVDESFPISDEQFNRIILIAAKRIKGELAF